MLIIAIYIFFSLYPHENEIFRLENVSLLVEDSIGEIAQFYFFFFFLSGFSLRFSFLRSFSDTFF